MSTRVRALLWEECRTGGVIALWCLFWAVGVVLFIFVHVAFGEMRIEDGVELAALVTVCTPLITSLLLTLTAANTGHLRGGFSERILRLPVPTATAVLVALLSRLLLVLVVGSAVAALSFDLFYEGPGLRTIFLIATIYLVIQTLDWLRSPAPLISLACIVLGLIWLLGYVVGNRHGFWTGMLEGRHGVSFPIFLAALPPACAISLWAVRAARCGERITPSAAIALEELPSLAGKRASRPFASPLAARVWFELRRSGAYLLVLVMLFWALGVLVVWLTSTINAPSSKLQSTPVAVSAAWLFEILPYPALLLAALTWIPLHLGTGQKGRAGMFSLLQPATTSTMVQARMIAAGICLGAVVLLIATVSTLSILFAHDGFGADLLSAALAHRETTLREVLAWLLGLPILAGLASWIYLNLLGTRTSGILAVCLAVLLVGAWSVFMIERTWLQPFTLAAMWFFILFIVGITVGTAFSAWKRGLVSGKSVAVCAALWAALMLFLCPFSSLMQAGPEFSVGAIYVCLTMGALAILPYFAIVLDLNRRRHGAGVAGNPAQHRRADRGRAAGASPASLARHNSGERMPASLRRVLRWAALVGAAAFLAWIRWPSEPAYKAILRSQGLPTNLAELDAWYPHVDNEHNLAFLCLTTARKAINEMIRWEYTAAPPQESSSEEWQIPASRRQSKLEYLPILGHPEVTRTKLIPPEVWHCTTDYWDKAGREAAAEWHAVARSGLEASRYPIDLGQGYSVELPHLARLRSLARVLALESLVGSVRKQPGVVVDAVLDILPIANSLEAEPLVVSQLVRIAVIETAATALEDAMSRVSFPAQDLERLQAELATALPSLDENGFILERAMIGEAILFLETDHLDLLLQERTRPRERRYGQSPGRLVLSTLLDVLQTRTFERVVGIRILWDGMNKARQVIDTGFQETSIETDKLPLPEDFLWHAPYASLWLPPLGRTHEPEWRVRTRLGLARTALAVERFRLAHGRLPDQLAALVPDFLDTIPRDPWNDGRPISYRIKDNGEFVVYSFALNRHDDLGELPPSGKNWWTEGDLTFTVAPPEVRDRPQIASVSGS